MSSFVATPQSSAASWKLDKLGLPTYDAFDGIFQSEVAAVTFMIDNGLLDFYKNWAPCPRCKRVVQCSFKKEWPKASARTVLLPDRCKVLRCKNRHDFSLFANTLFAKHIPKHKILHVIYLFLQKAPQRMIESMTGLARKTVSWLLKALREACEKAYFHDLEKGVQVGGPGIIVQIDEAKYGKRKYNRGHQIEGNWVFGAIEYIAGSEGKMQTGKFFACVVEERTEEYLKPIIETHIAPGSLIYSDCWKAYDKIGEWKWLPPIDGAELVNRYTSHQRVCHQYEFKAIDGTHTNAIEGYWRVSKSDIPNRYYHDAENLQEYLFYSMWRAKWRGNLWKGIISTLQIIRFSKKRNSIVRIEKSNLDYENGSGWVEEYDWISAI